MGRKKQDEKFRLEKELYYQTIWYIRRYPAFIQRREEILEGSAAPADGQPRGSGISDPTTSKALALELIAGELDPINAALEMIPLEYQKGIMSNIIERKPFPSFAAVKTWKTWKRRFVWYVAYFRGDV